ncbi:MAG: cysteine--tRNA ligase, partial [Bacteroidota bacterium]|nr:cysteine--tRNA ligase [Bacteroidota bacterium]
RFLYVAGEKMSKRLGNFFTVRDLTAPESDGGKGIDPLAVRMTLLSGHYRKPFNFTMKTLKGNVRHRERLDEVISLVGHPDDGVGEYEGDTGVVLQGMYEQALESMLDDLNTPAALAQLFGGTKMILGKGDNMDETARAAARRWLSDMNALLGVVYYDDAPVATEEEDPLAATVEPLIAERAAARADGNWGRADEIRDELLALGVEIKDSPEGTTWKRKQTI